MSTISTRRAAAPSVASDVARTPTAAELAWIAAPACALLTLAAIVLVGPLVGHLFLMPRRGVFWATIEADPQPLEHGRFLVGLLGAPLLAAVPLAWSASRTPRPALRPRTIRGLVLGAQVVLVAFLALCLAAQNDILFSADFLPRWPHRAFFTPATLIIAAALPALALLLLRSGRADRALARLAHETRARRIAGLVLAVAYTAVWMTTAFNLDSSIGNTIEAVYGHTHWTMSESFAVLDGRTPLVDFHAQYGRVWAYLAAVPMALFGATLGTYTAAMVTGTTLAMLAVYGVLRRLVRSSLAALLLYAPFVATAFYMVVGPLSDRYGMGNLYIMWPVRFSGPMLLAWLAARSLDGAAPRRAGIVFVVAALVVVNNPDFGVAATLATFAALASACWRGRRSLRRLTLEALAGGVVGIALFSLFTLARAGALPQFGQLSEFSRLYGIDGWEQLPMPELGLDLAIFLTFAAALVLAAVRVVQNERNGLLTGMLAWIGVFGLGASLYYAGRAHPMGLFVYFAPWALAVVLLLLAVLPGLAARRWRRVTLPELAILFAFGLVVCSLPQTPTPWSQVARIRDRTAKPLYQFPEEMDLVRATTHPGEKVALITTLGHRIAYEAGIVNVSPYSSVESIATHEQLRTLLDAMHREGASKLYITRTLTRPDTYDELRAAGYAPRVVDASTTFVLLTNRRLALRRR
ncbi:MAG: hypothetical protein ACTHOE_16075 [Conexibacter sp.]